MPSETLNYVNVVDDVGGRGGGGKLRVDALPDPRVETLSPFFMPELAHRTTFSPPHAFLILTHVSGYFTISPLWPLCQLVNSRFPRREGL